jgi:integrase
MSIKKYYTTKDGKKVFAGFRARPEYKGKLIAEEYFGPKEKTKAQVWHEKMVMLTRKSYDTSQTLGQACSAYLDGLKTTVNGRAYVRQGIAAIERDASHWLKKSVIDLRPMDINQLLTELDKNSEKRLGRPRLHLKREIELLHAVFEDYRCKLNNDYSNPVNRRHKEKWGRGRSKVAAPTSHSPVEAQALLAYLKGLPDPVYYHTCLWQLTSNRQRLGEVLSLEWSDVDWDQQIAWITGTMQWCDEFGRTLRNTKQHHTKEGRDRIAIPFGGNNFHLKQSLLELRNLHLSERWVFADKKGLVPTLRQMNKVYKRSGFFNERFLGTHKCRKTALTLATIEFGSDIAKTFGGHATDSAHVRYIDRHLREMNNPAPARIAETLGILRTGQKNGQK